MVTPSARPVGPSLGSAASFRSRSTLSFRRARGGLSSCSAFGGGRRWGASRGCSWRRWGKICMSYTPLYPLSYPSLSGGGCLPMRYNTWRILTRPARFTFNASTVVRPVGVKPTICVRSSLQQKWSCHLCRRGLYNGTRVLSVGSGASVLLYLCPLQKNHTDYP